VETVNLTLAVMVAQVQHLQLPEHLFITQVVAVAVQLLEAAVAH
jgi:hypothetical protein